MSQWYEKKKTQTGCEKWTCPGKSTFGHPKVFHDTDVDDTYSTYLSSGKGNDNDCPY